MCAELSGGVQGACRVCPLVLSGKTECQATCESFQVFHTQKIRGRYVRKATHMSKREPSNRKTAVLWVFGGVAVAFGAAVIYDELVGHLGALVAWSFILVVGPLLGIAGHRWWRRNRSSAPSPDQTSSVQQPPPEQAASDQPSPEQDRQTTVRTNTTVFVSYRRSDSADVTGRIYEHLSRRFGMEKVFKDVDSIGLGQDFRKVIGDAVSDSSVVIVVIGKNWTGTDSTSAESRINDTKDYVRTEVSCALKQDKPVIPVFVAGAKMPDESELPGDIQGLTYRNGLQVRPDPDFSVDVQRLIKGIEQA